MRYMCLPESVNSTRPCVLFSLVGPRWDSNLFFTICEMSLEASTWDIPRYLTAWPWPSISHINALGFLFQRGNYHIINVMNQLI